MYAEIRADAFNPWDELARYERSTERQAGSSGATAVFVGTMRDRNDGDRVNAMVLEHYPEMTAGYLDRICEEATVKWRVQDLLVLHRVGEIRVGETIVLVAAWSEHRAAAFDACRYLIEELKHRAPFWKKETLADGDLRWVDSNTPA